ncbi:glycosyltransferase [Nocardia sp. NPDC004573]
MIGVMLGLGDYRETARLSASRAEAMTDLEFRVIEHAPAGFPRDAFPGFVKLWLFELAEAHTILYLDSDAVVLRPWQVTALAGRDEFICVRDQFIGLYPEYDSDLPRDTYFNAGVFIANRRAHQELFAFAAKLWRDRARPLPIEDQSALNYAVHTLGTPTLFLPDAYNYLRAHVDDRENDEGVVIAHYTPSGITQAHRKLLELGNRPTPAPPDRGGPRGRSPEQPKHHK